LDERFVGKLFTKSSSYFSRGCKKGGSARSANRPTSSSGAMGRTGGIGKFGLSQGESESSTRQRVRGRGRIRNRLTRRVSRVTHNERGRRDDGRSAVPRIPLRLESGGSGLARRSLRLFHNQRPRGLAGRHSSQYHAGTAILTCIYCRRRRSNT